jgi:hypothetical protein
VIDHREGDRMGEMFGDDRVFRFFVRRRVEADQVDPRLANGAR